MNEPRVLGTLMYEGVKRNLVLNEQGPAFAYRGGQFTTHHNVSSQEDWPRLVQLFDDFCKDQMENIIWKGVRDLRWKKVTTGLPYVRKTPKGDEPFTKEVTMSVDEYLDATGFSRDLKWEIGKFQREWGINAIDTRKKTFTLYFNLDLIKYDDGPHIKHVVAHELAHVFHRDHGEGFQSVLSQLDPSSQWSQKFFNGGISALGKSPKWTIWIIIALLVFVLGYLGYSWLIENLATQPTQNLNF